jgi:tRNA modification GTPase
LELVAEDLKLARKSLDAIVGVKTPDSLLGDIFSNFCIGK